jgi:hypothetical protein
MVRVLVYVFVGTSTGTGTCTCACRGTWGLFVAEDYGTVIRGGVSASQFVVVRCNMYSCCAMGVCEVIIWESSEEGTFGFSVFCERKKSLTRGRVKDIGSTTGIQCYISGVRRVVSGMCVDIIPVPPYLRDSGTLRGSCRAPLMGVCGCLLLRGCLMMRRGCSRECSVVYDSSW